MPEFDRDAEFFTTPLQDLEQTQARNSREAVAMNGNLLIAMDYIDIVPGFKVLGDGGVGRFISGLQVAEGLPGKHHAPAKRIVRAVAFVDSNVVCGVGALHEDGEVHPGRTATDD